MKTSIVTTTINVPFLLRRLAEDARAYGHDSVEFVVIGDRKTSPEASDFCRKVDRDLAPVVYQDLEQQRKYLSRFPALCPIYLSTLSKGGTWGCSTPTNTEPTWSSPSMTITSA